MSSSNFNVNLDANESLYQAYESRIKKYKIRVICNKRDTPSLLYHKYHKIQAQDPYMYGLRANLTTFRADSGEWTSAVRSLKDDEQYQLNFKGY